MPRTITRLSVPTVMSFRTAQTRSKPEEQRRIADVAHGYIGKNDVGCEQLGLCRLPDVDGDRTIHPRSSRGGYYGLQGHPLHRLPLDLQRNGGNDVRLLSRLRTAANRDQRRDDQPGDRRQRAAAVAAPRLSPDP